MLLLRALLSLLHIELYLWAGSFNALYKKVRNCPVSGKPTRAGTAQQVSRTFDLACICYPKRALCLQRSAALTCLLRREGIKAQMIIGAQRLPFRAHAWVELEGTVINDRPYVRRIYQVLEIC